MEVGRETTNFSLTVQPKDLAAAVELLADIVKNPLLNKSQVEAERELLVRNSKENVKDQMETTIEAAHYTVKKLNYVNFLK